MSLDLQQFMEVFTGGVPSDCESAAVDATIELSRFYMDEVCNEESVRALIESPQVYTFTDCMAMQIPSVLSMLPHVSWPTIRDFYDCERNFPTTESDASDVSATSDTIIAVYLFSTGLILMLYTLTRSDPVRFASKYKNVFFTWWIVALLLAASISTNRRRKVDPMGFLVHDEVTKCALDLEKTLPTAVFKDRFMTFVTDTVRLRDDFRLINTHEVDGFSMKGICGYCMLQCTALNSSSNALIDNLLFGRPLEQTEVVVCNQVFPYDLSLNWRAAFSNSVDALGIDFMTREQFEKDVMVSISSQYMFGIFSILLLYIMVWVSTMNIRFTMSITLSLGGALLLSDALSSIFNIPYSPFDVLISPVLMGTGVDSALLMLHAYRKNSAPGWTREPLISIVASQVSTILCFGIGVYIPVKNISNFFKQSILAFCTSMLMQLSVFPALVKSCIDPLEDNPWPTRLKHSLWKYCTVIIIILNMFVFVNVHQPPGSNFDIKRQISTATKSYRTIESVDAVMLETQSPIYAHIRDYETCNTSYVRQSFAQMTNGCCSSLFWADAYDASDGTISDWLSNPIERATYGPFIDTKSHKAAAVVLYPTSLSESSYVHADFVRNMETYTNDDVCFTNFERLGSYTLVKLQMTLLKLAGISCVIASVVAVTISNYHGLGSSLALLGTYVTTTALMSMTGIQFHMMVMSAFLVAPGLVMDFAIHISHDVDYVAPVTLSALTSIASMVPYAFMSIHGIRDFAIVYIMFISVGCVYAICTTATRAMGYDSIKIEPT